LLSKTLSLLVIGPLSTNGLFLKEAFSFFDAVYVSHEIPNDEMSMLFFAKRPQIVLMSITEEPSPLLFDYIQTIKQLNPQIVIVIAFKENVSIKTIDQLFQMRCDYYSFFQEQVELIQKCLKDIRTLYVEKKEAYIMKRYHQYLLDNSIVSQTDIHGNITFVNDHFCTFTGFERHEIMGKNHRFMRHPSNSDALYASMWKTISSGKVWRERVLNQNKDGSEFWADTIIIPFVDEQSGEILEYTAIRRDITKVLKEKKETEAKALLATQELKIASAKEAFLSLFSHELKTPLNTIINFTHYLHTAKAEQKKIEETREKHLLGEINKSASLMLTNVTTILDLQKLRAQKLNYTLSTFDVKCAIENVIVEHTPLANEYKRHIDFQPCSNTYLHTDEYRFSQIIANILSNAIKYGNRDIVLRCDVIGNELCLCVEDDGKGIKEKEKVFELFEQDGTKMTLMQKKGTGIGLYFLKLLCEDLHFICSIEDSVSLGGTKFILKKLLKESHAKNTRR